MPGGPDQDAGRGDGKRLSSWLHFLNGAVRIYWGIRFFWSGACVRVRERVFRVPSGFLA